jgi:hypothetical protein
MTQGVTAWAAVVFLDGWETVVPWLKFSCHQADQRHINESPVKALLPGRGDLLRLSRVGRWPLAYAFPALASSSKNEPLDQAQAVGLTTADFPQITIVDGVHYGRHRQTKG